MRRSASIIITLALVLAACSPSDGGDETTTTETGIEETTTTAGVEETTTTAEAMTTTQPEATGGSSCVEGQWLLSPETFISVMEEVAEGEAELGDVEISPSEGTYLVTMASDGTYTGERDDWGFSVSTPDGEFDIRMNGTESGTWSADDTTITVTVAASDMAVQSTATFDGQTITLPESPVEVPEAIAESSTYTCNDDTLAVTTDGFTVELDRA